MLQQGRVGETPRRRLLDDAPALEDGNAVGDAHGELQIVRDENHARARIGKRAQVIDSMDGELDIETGRGLIGDEDARLLHKRTHEQHAPHHATRQLVRIHVLHVGRQAIGAEQLALAHLAAHAVDRPL